jgi:predicted DNA-binding transcriptional regulator AlpA
MGRLAFGSKSKGDIMDERLVNVKELAAILKMPKSWIYQKTMLGPDAIPFIKFGKYLRFRPSEVIAFFESNKRKTIEKDEWHNR